MRNSKKSIYSGQAIAIIMVILVVATVLGASLYSRTLKNREAAINTKDSIKAVEQADSLLDLFVRADFQFLQELAQEIQTDGEQVFENTTEIKGFLDGKSVDSSMIGQITDWCEYDAEDNPSSNLKLTIAEALPSDFVDVRVGSARVFNLEGNTYQPTPCSLALTFEARESSPTIFAIKKIYGDSNNIAEYVNDPGTVPGIDDIKAYCFTPTTPGCTPDELQGIAAPEGSFLDLEANYTVPIDLKEMRDALPLYQIRVIPLNNTVGISHSDVSGCSTKSFSYMKVNAAVNCYGSFREKQIMVPGADSLGYSSLFDYAIYNIGTLRPNN